MVKEKNKPKRKNWFLRKLFRPIIHLSEAIVDSFVHEIKKAIGDFITGILSFLIAIVFFLFFWAFLNILMVFALKKIFGLEYYISISIMAGLNLLLSYIAFLFGKSKFSRDE